MPKLASNYALQIFDHFSSTHLVELDFFFFKKRLKKKCVAQIWAQLSKRCTIFGDLKKHFTSINLANHTLMLVFH